MKRNLLALLYCTCFCTLASAQNVPNGGFENWTGGNPDNWYTDNISPIGTPITQATPAHGGNFALEGQVVSTGSGPLAPLVQSTDMSGNGFAVTQAYSTLTFFYKTNLTGASSLLAVVSMKDAGTNIVGGGAMVFTSSVSSFTSASVPIYYSTANPAKCVIQFSLSDTTSGTPPVGNYFIIDDVSLSGLAGVQENMPPVNIENIFPNPANTSALLNYNLQAKSDVRFQVMNLQGKIVRETWLPETGAGKHEMKFDVAALPAGFYLVRMKTNNGSAFSPLEVLH